MTRLRVVSRGQLCVVALAVALFLVGASTAAAATPSAGWSISSLAAPTSFSSTDECGKSSEEKAKSEARCDAYMVTATNTGSEPMNSVAEPVTISDVLPSGLTVRGIRTQGNGSGEGFEFAGQNYFPCTHTTTTVTCTFSGAAPPGDVLAVWIDVEVNAGVAPNTVVTNTATVEGGGAPAASTAVENPVNSTAPTEFGIQDFALTPYGVNGAPDVQAGEHPYALTSSFDLNTLAGEPGLVEAARPPVQDPKDVVVYLPLGLVGDPLAAERCTEAGLAGEQPGFESDSAVSRCPAGSRVGTVTVDNKGKGYTGTVASPATASAVYNMAPEGGYPAAFGFVVASVKVVMFASVVDTPRGYMLRVAVPGILRGEHFVGVSGVTLSLFSDPAQADGGNSAPSAFFTNPGDCSAGPLKARIEADSWEAPGDWQSRESVVYPDVTGCDMLQFAPKLEARPETTTVDEPSGWTIDLKVPQSANVWPDLTTPDLKDATVALPEGVSVSPGAADGLAGCQATGPEGIDMPSGSHAAGEAGEGEEIGPDGLSHLVAGHCPSASKIGEVEIKTPLLKEALEGNVYLAQPQCGGQAQEPCKEADATNGKLFGLYLEAAGSGVVVKLKGTVSANPTTGQLTTTFAENPQLPFEDLKLSLKSGPRAPLSNPQRCGTATTSSDLVPWSSPQTPDATPAYSFPVTGCGSSWPFNPGFLAQSGSAQAGAFTPFTVSFSRHDGEQDLSDVQVSMPPGLLGMLSQVPRCGEPQASLGTCPASSRIGTTTVASGAGSHPLALSGPVYLTGPYRGAPFGLSVVVPAVAGPFNLGDVVVRAAISVNPSTSAVTITSDPLPQSLDGVPFRLQSVNVTVDRPGFMFNPTDCAQQKIAATITSAQGAAASGSSPFAVSGCASLPYKPGFSATAGRRSTRANGVSLDLKITSSAGQANTGKVRLVFPKQLPARLSTLKGACLAAVFDANPGSCPAASVIGIAVAHTPVLSGSLQGPIYLVSHGGAAFPDAEVVLQGEGVTLILDGKTDIVKGITSSTFRTVPDAPFTTFEAKLPAGPHSAFAATLPESAKGSLCGVSWSLPSIFAGQNGAQLKRSTKIAVSSCPKAKPKKKAKSKKKGKTAGIRHGNHGRGGR